jgi:hypothetical protein
VRLGFTLLVFFLIANSEYFFTLNNVRLITKTLIIEYGNNHIIEGSSLSLRIFFILTGKSKKLSVNIGPGIPWLISLVDISCVIIFEKKTNDGIDSEVFLFLLTIPQKGKLKAIKMTFRLGRLEALIRTTYKY